MTAASEHHDAMMLLGGVTPRCYTKPVPTQHPRIPVTNDAELAEALARVEHYFPDARTARIVRELAHARPLFQRSVKLPDLLIAAAAADVAIGVLHYDQDYDTLATVLNFESRWIAPRGSR